MRIDTLQEKERGGELKGEKLVSSLRATEEGERGIRVVPPVLSCVILC